LAKKNKEEAKRKTIVIDSYVRNAGFLIGLFFAWLITNQIHPEPLMTPQEIGGFSLTLLTWWIMGFYVCKIIYLIYYDHAQKKEWEEKMRRHDTLTKVSLSPVTQELLVGDTLQFEILGKYLDYSERPYFSPVKWVSSEPAIALFKDESPVGEITALQEGETIATATVQGVHISAVITVLLPPKEEEELSPNTKLSL
jgi:hypothetical protein